MSSVVACPRTHITPAAAHALQPCARHRWVATQLPRLQLPHQLLHLFRWRSKHCHGPLLTIVSYGCSDDVSQFQHIVTASSALHVIASNSTIASNCSSQFHKRYRLVPAQGRKCQKAQNGVHTRGLARFGLSHRGNTLRHAFHMYL